MQLVMIVLASSFFLESIFSNFISMSSTLFLPLFTIVSLVIIYPFFKKEISTYYKTAAILGLFYDIVFTDTVIVNFFLFLIVAWAIDKMNYMLSNNYLNVGIMSLLSVVLYRILSYFVLVIIGYFPFSIFALEKGITSSIILNVIYGVFMYGIADHFAHKYHILKID